MMDISELEAEYRRRAGLFASLADEIRHVLERQLDKAGIKIDSIEARVKDITSIVRKAENKNIVDPLSEISDIVGSRVICLFKSDIDRIGEEISKCFSVISKDDKISENEDTFGYMSVHFICKLLDEYKGPRYDHLKGVVFEVQVRTLCMHAWAAISHHLDYKTEYDVPRELKKIFNALSGLFYVADTQFEQAYDARVESRKIIQHRNTEDNYEDVKINFDTLQVYMDRKYPERNYSGSADISDLVQEITEYGLKTIEEIDKIMDATKEEFEKDERERRPKKLPFFTRVGAIRVSLGLSDPKYEQLVAERSKKKSQDSGAS